MVASESVQKYFDALLQSYDILTEAVTKANERGIKISQTFAADVVKGQREALELGKKLATSETPDPGQFYTAVLEATTAAQSRALAFTQAAYQEALGSGAEARDTIEKLVKANSETAKAAMDATKAWSASNPLADIFRRNVEMMNSVNPIAPKKTATK
jgi:hypothetical protein